jgi:sugar phosphate permease
MQKHFNIRPWLVVFSAASFVFLINSSNNLNVIIPYLSTKFNASKIGFLFACYYYSNIIFVFWAGIILDKISTKKILIISLLVANCSILVFATTKSLTLMAFARLALGIVGSFSMLICFQLIKRWFPREKTALITGFVTTYAAFGSLFSQTPLVLTIERLGWEAGLLLNFWLGILFFVFALIFVQDFPTNNPQQVINNKISVWQEIKKTIKNYRNWFAGFYTTLFSLPMLFFSASWGILYLKQVGDLTEIESSQVINASIIGSIIGSSFIGWLSSRFHACKIYLFYSSILTAVIFLIFIYITKISLFAYIGLFFLLGLTTSSQVLILPLVTGNNSHSLVGIITGFIATLTALSGICIQFLGWLMDYCKVNGDIYNYIPIMWILLGMVIISAFLICFIKETCDTH